jgi:branched-chain amino acid transport system substrate-binding protein
MVGVRGRMPFLAFMLAVAGGLGLESCSARAISIGFIGDLTGKQSELGVSGRNGALLRIEQANSGGEIRGAFVRLVTEDDDNKPESFRAAVNALVALGIPAAIGPYTSSMAELAAADTRLFFLSPTASAASLSGRYDMLFRLMTPSSVGAKALGEMTAALKARTASILHDSDNELYARDFIASFRASFEAAGGRVLASESYSSSAKDLRFAPMLERLLADRPSALLTVANGSDTALVIRRAKQLLPGILPLASGWAATTDFLRFGGAAMDGTLFEQQFDPASISPAYLKFVAAYRTRFGSMPSFSSMYSFEAAGILIDAMSGGGTPAGIRQRILAKPRVQGLQAEYGFDSHGDVTREDSVYIVRGSEYQALK